MGATHLAKHHDAACLLCRDEAIAILNDAQARADVEAECDEAEDIDGV